MIHCVLHDPRDSVAVVVVEGVTAGTTLTGLILDEDRTITLPCVQEVVGGMEARLAVNARLIDSFAGDFDDGVVLSASESNIVKLNVTNNAVAVVEDALSLTSNHGLTRANPLERHYRDVLCGRVHTPQDDATRLNAGRLVLGV